MTTQYVPPSIANAPIDRSFLSYRQSSPLWDRLSKWASDNKAIIYTIAGVAVVISGAGAVYYFSDSRTTGNNASEDIRRASKREKRKAKKEKEKEEKADSTVNQTAQTDEQGVRYFGCL